MSKQITLSKNEELILKMAIDEYKDLFSKIIQIPQKEFMTMLEKYLEITLTPKNIILPSANLKKILNIIQFQYYQKEYDKINQLIHSINSISSFDKFNGPNYFPHCNNNKEPIHSCGRKLFILNNFEYLLCLNCKKIYHPHLILLYCKHCSCNFYTGIDNSTSEEDKKYKVATWVKYHCNGLINDIMRCPTCKNVIYLNVENKKLKCKKCNFEVEQNEIKWNCAVCKHDFFSDAKIYNPFEYKILKIALKETIYKGIEAKPDFVPCCNLSKEQIQNYKFYHKIECNGLILRGELDNKKIVVCVKCHMLNYYHLHNWLCPVCKKRFRLKDYFNKGKRNKSEVRNLNMNSKTVDNENVMNVRNNNYTSTSIGRKNNNLQKKSANFLGAHQVSLTEVKKDINSNYPKRVSSYNIYEQNSNNKSESGISDFKEENKESENKEEINDKNEENEDDKNINEENDEKDNKDNDYSMNDTNTSISLMLNSNILNQSHSLIRNHNINKDSSPREQSKGASNISIINLNYNLSADVMSPTNHLNLPNLNSTSNSNQNLLNISNNINFSNVSMSNKSNSISNKSNNSISNKTNNTNNSNTTTNNSNTTTNNSNNVINNTISNQTNNSTNTNNSSNQNVIENKQSENKIIEKKIIQNKFNSDDYNIITQIGEGTFGKIYKVEGKNKIKYAMKKILANSLTEINALQNEYEMLLSLTPYNLNLVNIHGIETKKLDKTTFVMYVLMDIAIRDWEKEILLRGTKKKFYTEKELITILKELIHTFAELQRHKISHRDIKPQNILLFPDNKFKISDFGEAKELMTNNRATIKQTIRGTELYMSPILFRALQKKTYNKYTEHNTFKSDVFSLGLCILFAATLTFNSLCEIREINDSKFIKLILKKYLEKKYTNKFNEFLFSMLEVDEKNRDDFIELEKKIQSL